MKKVFLGRFDTFRPNFVPPNDEFGYGYGGELSLCCVQDVDAFNALEQMLTALKSGGAILRSVDFFGEYSEYEHDMSFFGLGPNELLECAIDSGRMVFSDKVLYGSEE